MAPEAKSDLKLEIAHVLTMDVVQYSTLLITDQARVMAELTTIVKGTQRFRRAEAEEKLIRIPTGDGMALVFFDDPQAPIECAMEIATALKSHPEIRLRMGIHSGPVNPVVDVSDRSNVTGAGIDIAQRVMDCGDAGHILLSRRVADDLAPFPRWNPYLHGLGECKVKHGRRISLVNFYTEAIGNPARPKKCLATTGRFRRKFSPVVAASAAIVALVAVVALFLVRTSRWDIRGRPSTASPAKSIAVLPFENLSHDPENAYFADGIQEEILTRLSKIADLKVISRTSTRRYQSNPNNLPEIAKQLGVAHILEGTVQKAADQVRVNVQLINAQTDAHIWAEKFDRNLADIFAVESEIAAKIAQTLEAKLTGVEQKAIAARPTESAEAHQLYLKGRYFLSKRTEEGLRKSIEYFSQAIAKDPRYALAYSGLADSNMYLLRVGFLRGSSRKDIYEKAKAAATNALELDDNLAEAHTSLALIKMEYEWDWTGSEREFQRAIQLNPGLAEAHHQYSHYLTAMGRTSESLAESFRALELDPLSLVLNAHLAWHYLYARQYDQTVQQCQKPSELDRNYPETAEFRGLAFEQKGMYQDAIAQLQTAMNLSGSSPHIKAELGHAYAVAGNSSEALQILNELKSESAQTHISNYDIAVIYIGLGRKDEALEVLENAYQERSEWLRYVKVDPRLDPLRGDPRFEKLANQVVPPNLK
jgi:TolB-like protein/Flp pilus assembly protein TadD